VEARRVSVLAAIRPDDWGLPLFLHVLGAFALVGAVVMAASYLFLAGRDGSVELTRLGFRSLWMGALPAYVVARAGSEWIASEEDLADSNATWIGIGYGVMDIGLLILIGATIATGLAARRATANGRGVAITAWLLTVLIAAYAVAIWAMATKPT
jgi:hypothetical protein